MNTTKMKVEVWSDIMCPFCYIGKRHYEGALEKFANKNNIEIEWKSFQLDPSIPDKFETKTNVYQYLAYRKGMSYQQSVDMHKQVVEMAADAGLTYNFDKAVVANSYNSHRIIQLAKTKGLGDVIEERFFLAYFTEGKDLADINTLIQLGKEVGLTEAEVKEALVSDAYSNKIKADWIEAQNIGVRGVPFFVFNRKYAVSGAQPEAMFLKTIEKSFEEWRAENPDSTLEVSEGPGCSTDGKCD